MGEFINTEPTGVEDEPCYEYIQRRKKAGFLKTQGNGHHVLYRTIKVSARVHSREVLLPDVCVCVGHMPSFLSCVFLWRLSSRKTRLLFPGVFQPQLAPSKHLLLGLMPVLVWSRRSRGREQNETKDVPRVEGRASQSKGRAVHELKTEMRRLWKVDQGSAAVGVTVGEATLTQGGDR